MDNKKPLIAIAVPSTSGLVHISWTRELLLLSLPAPGYLTYVSGTPIGLARQKLINNILTSPATHVFFLDSDVIPPRDAIVKLFRHDMPIVCGHYCHRASGAPGVYRMDSDGNYKTLPKEDLEKNELLTGRLGTGLGCALIKREVFDKIPRPYFHTGWLDEACTVQYGEDFFFFDQAHAAEIPVYVDTSVRALHIDNSILRWDGTRAHLNVENINGEWRSE